MSDELEELVNEGTTTVETIEDSQSPETGETDTTVEKEAAPTAPVEEPKEPTMVPLAAKQAEKEKRQRAEQDNTLLRQQLEALKTPVEVPDAYSEPDKYVEHKLSETKQSDLTNKINGSDKLARMEYDDYDVHADYFVDVVAKTNPQLVQEMLASPDPARFAYLNGKSHKSADEAKTELDQAGGLEAYAKSIEAKVRAEIAAEKPETTVPPDLTNARSTGGDPTTTIPAGNDGLEAILGR